MVRVSNRIVSLLGFSNSSHAEGLAGETSRAGNVLHPLPQDLPSERDTALTVTTLVRLFATSVSEISVCDDVGAISIVRTRCFTSGVLETGIKVACSTRHFRQL